MAADKGHPPESGEKILIMGTGALACLFAARLSASGVTPQMWGTWDEGLQTLRSEGVRISTSETLPPTDPLCANLGDPIKDLAFPVQIISRPSQCKGARYALVLVKSWQTQRAASQLARCLSPNGLALTLQNGTGNMETLAQVLGEKRVSLGVTTVGATLLGPGCVRQVGTGVVTLGADPRLAPLAQRLQAAGFVVEIGTDPTALLWGKLVINAAINPLSALLRVPNGELLRRESARTLLQAIAGEAAAVAAAQGIHLPYPDPVIASEAIARNTENNLSSMLQDVLRGAPTEIDAICGAIVQAGEAHGVPTPILQTMWSLVKAIRPNEHC